MMMISNNNENNNNSNHKKNDTTMPKNDTKPTARASSLLISAIPVHSTSFFCSNDSPKKNCDVSGTVKRL